jgi:hypothetical protein
VRDERNTLPRLLCDFQWEPAKEFLFAKGFMFARLRLDAGDVRAVGAGRKHVLYVQT